MTLRLAMLGLGAVARYYLDALPRVEGFRLAAVCDRDLARLDAAPLGVPAARDYRAMLARRDVVAVLINLPNDLHATACADALRADKHVCCEKPLTLDPVDAEGLVALARARGRTLFTAFHRRYNANLLAALPRLRGEVVAARARYHELIEDHIGGHTWYLDPSRCGGGSLADNGPNAFDALRHVLGPLTPRRVALDRDERSLDLRARVELTAAGGAPVTVELDWGYRHGELKDLVFEPRDGDPVRVDLLAGFPGFKSSLRHEYEGVLRDFAHRVRRGGEHGEEGAEIVRLVARAYELARGVPVADA